MKVKEQKRTMFKDYTDLNKHFDDYVSKLSELCQSWKLEKEFSKEYFKLLEDEAKIRRKSLLLLY